MKDKIKKAVCLGLVFITSFMLTVTAFADDTTGFDYFVGHYSNVDGPGYVSLSSDFLFSIVCYRDDNHGFYIGGSRGEGRLGTGKKGFDAIFSKAIRTNADGSLPTNPSDRETIPNYNATGKVTRFFVTKIESYQSDCIYQK